MLIVLLKTCSDRWIQRSYLLLYGYAGREKTYYCSIIYPCAPGKGLQYALLLEQQYWLCVRIKQIGKVLSQSIRVYFSNWRAHLGTTISSIFLLHAFLLQACERNISVVKNLLAFHGLHSILNTLIGNYTLMDHFLQLV